MTALSRELREHQDALASLVDRLAEVGGDAWDRPVANGKWSPAEITRHLTLTYENAIQDLDGGPPPRPRAGQGWQRLFRWVVLPHILFHRSFPLRVRAPREWRPESDLPPREVSIVALTAAAHAFAERALVAHGEGRRLRHPYFGEIDIARALRLNAVHLQHHQRQVLHCLKPSRAAHVG